VEAGCASKLGHGVLGRTAELGQGKRAARRRRWCGSAVGPRWAVARKLGQKQGKRRVGKEIAFCYFSKEIKQMNSKTDLNSTKQK
jgi:hypothetical protein